MSSGLPVIRQLAERELVLAIMDAAIQWRRSALSELAAWFEVAWIQEPFLRDVATRVLQIVKDSRPMTVLELTLALRGRCKDHELPLPQVQELWEKAYGWPHLTYLGRRVYDEHRRVNVTQDLADGAEDLSQGADIDETLQQVADIPKKYLALHDTRAADQSRAVDEIIAEMEGRVSTKFETGFAGIDKFLSGGLSRGSLMTVAAATGCGKSVLLGQLAIMCALRDKRHALFFAAEMSEKDLCERWAAWVSRHPRYHRREYIGGLAEVAQQTRRDGLLHLFTGTRHVDTICREVEAYCAMHDVGIVCVDYLQLFRGGGPKDTRERQVADVTNKLKALAVDQKIAIATASQINRAAQGTPRLQHLRESGAIEQDSDVVLLLDPADRDKTPVNVTIVIGKNRQGETGMVDVEWDKPIFRMYDPGSDLNLPDPEEDADGDDSAVRDDA